MNNIILYMIILLSLAKLSIQDCCFISSVTGDGQITYLLKVSVTPAAEQMSFSYVENYQVVGLQNGCTLDQSINKVTCQGSPMKENFETIISLREPNNKIISSVDLDVHANGSRCQRSYDICNPDGSINTQNGDNFCFFFGCFPKLACYIGIGVFVVCISGIALAVIRRNSGSAENAALDRPNTKAKHLDAPPNPIGGGLGSGGFGSSSNNNNKETLIQIDEMPVDFKEAGKTNWVANKYKSPPNLNKDLGLGLGSGGFGSTSSLLPQTSNVTVLNDPAAGLNRGRSVKRVQSTKKPRNTDSNHLNPPPLPTSSLGRTRSTRSTKSVRSVKSTKSIRKPRPSEEGLSKKKSVRAQPSQKRYQIPSDSESDSDSDNEVLGLRAKPSMKKPNGTSSLPRKPGYHSSVKASYSTKSKSSKSSKSPTSSPRYYR